MNIETIHNFITSREIVITAAIFLAYGVIGWFVESCYMSYCNRKVTNRGFIRGPICPIYGLGELIVYHTLLPYADHYVVLFFAGAVFATTVEYLVARLLIYRFGCLWWDYSQKPLNYKGILCLESSIAWGIYTIVEFGFLHKVVVGGIQTIPYGVLTKLVVAGFIYLFVSAGLAYRRASHDGVEEEENNVLSFKEES